MASLIHGDPRAGCAIQQPLEVKAGKLIISILTNMRCECRDCAGVARFQFGKGLQITLCRGIIALFRRQRFEGAQGLRPAPQQKVPHRTAPEVRYLCREDCADANAGAELFVGGFQPRRDIDGVAIGCVVEEAAATEIADDRRSGMNTDPCDSQRDFLFLPAHAECLRVFVQSQCASDSSGSMVRLLARGSEKHMQGIADNLCYGAVVREARRRQAEAERAHASLSRYFSPNL